MTTDTLTTEGQNASGADLQQSADTTTEGLAPNEGTKAGEQQQPTDGETAEGQQAASDKTEGAPEKYEFTPTENSVFDDAVMGAYSEAAKELNLSQEAAQKVLDKVAPVIQARQAEKISEARTQWETESRTDKEIGGAKFDENMAVAKKARDAFASQALVDLLNATGLGNHPEINRFFYRAGKAISEDSFVGSGQGSTQPATAQKLYSASNMNP